MNRCKKAREQAGLSVGQAAKMMDITVIYLNELEGNEPVPFFPHVECMMVDYYCCSLEWLRGEGPDKDYEALNKIPGARELSFHDRDILAEFIASQGKRK